MKAQWLMLQQDAPEDYVIATDKQYSVRQFVETACGQFCVDVRWEGAGENEKGYDAKTGACLATVDP